MKKSLLLSLFSFLCLFQANAQWGNCAPDLIYADSSFGVFPAPLNAANPDGGIPTTACVGGDYYFTWTMKIPEVVETSLLTVNVDSIVVTADDAIINLPTGMTYAMNPENGVFTPEDSLACITIFGTPQQEGTYDLKIVLTIYSQDLIIVGGSQTFELPSNLIAGAEGNYFLVVEPAGTAGCFTSVDDVLAESFSVRNLPNPFSNYTNVEIVAEHSDDLIFRVYDLIGNEIHRENIQVIEGINNFEFDGSHLSNGIYTYMIEKDGALVTSKMVINR